MPPTAVSSRLHLRTLGGLSLDGADLTRPKPLIVLAYLLLEGATSRGAVAELFFGDAADPRDSLATALRHLRRAGTVVDEGADRCAAADGVTLDAIDLLQAFDQHLDERVIAAYAGPFLEGHEVGLGVDAEAWVLETREAVASRVRSAFLQVASRTLVQGELDAARSALREATRVRGAPEFEADELRTALALARRLDVPEAAQLRALAAGYGMGVDEVEGSRRARVGDEAALHRATRFVGRTAELARLDDLVRGGAQVVSLVGMGGVGKTRLALRFAERAELERVRFPHGVHVVGFDGSSADVDVSRHVAARLGIESDRATQHEVASWLASHPGLLLLDNVEHVRGVAAFVDEVARRCPETVVLLTSRVRLALEAEYIVDLDGLSTSGGPSRTSDAAALFHDRALRVGTVLDDDPAIRADVDALCAELGGYPLGIELAAAWTRLLGVDAILATLRRSPSSLDAGAAALPDRHRALEATLGPSLAMLDERDLACLRSLATFAASFAADAALAVAGASLPTLARLVDRALVRSTGGGRGRFVLHPVLREFVRGGTPDDDRVAAADAHRRFFAGLLERSASTLSDDPDAVLGRLELDLPDVVLALDRAVVGAPEDAIAMARHLLVDVDLFQARPASGELVELGERVAALAIERGDAAAARALTVKVANAHRLFGGDTARARAGYERALALATADGDVPQQVMLHAILGVLTIDDAPEVTTNHMAEAERLAADDPLLTCEVLQRQGFVASQAGDWDRVRALNGRAVEITTRLLETHHGDERRVASLHFFCLYNLGAALDHARELAAALEVRERALEFAQARGQRLWTAYAQHELAFSLVDAGRLDEAARHARAAYRTLCAMGADGDVALLRADAATWGIDLDEAEGARLATPTEARPGAR